MRHATSARSGYEKPGTFTQKMEEPKYKYRRNENFLIFDVNDGRQQINFQ